MHSRFIFPPPPPASPPSDKTNVICPFTRDSLSRNFLQRECLSDCLSRLTHRIRIILIKSFRIIPSPPPPGHAQILRSPDRSGKKISSFAGIRTRAHSNAARTTESSSLFNGVNSSLSAIVSVCGTSEGNFRRFQKKEKKGRVEGGVKANFPQTPHASLSARNILRLHYSLPDR